MCGIICGTKKVLEASGIEGLLIQQKHRGDSEGYGAIAMYSKSSSKSFKSMRSAKVIEWIEELEGNPFIFIHHRATSVGGTNIKLAHPLKYNTTILIQNGTNKDPYYMVESSESDSEALAMLADSMSPTDFAKYILKAVGVVIYRKDEKFYLYKDGSRPLNQHKTGLLCSEPLVPGEWKKVKEGFYPVSLSKGKLEGLEYEATVSVEDIGKVKYCATCKKRHLIPIGFEVCNACVVSGKVQKKDYTRRNSGNNHYADDYYEDEYAVNFPYNKKKQVGYNNSRTNKVFALVTPSIVTKKDTIKMKGIPVSIDGGFYLVPGNSHYNVETYYVVALDYSVNASKYFRGGYVPNGSGGFPIELSSYDFTPYWDDSERVYDLLHDIYYEVADELMEADREILVFDKYMGAFILPLDYNYIPSSYSMSCSNC